MSYIFKCKWCGREYDNRKSTASDYATYCSGKCEAEAKRSKMEAEKLELEKRKLRQESGGSGGDGCSSAMIKWGVIVFIIIAIIGMCSDDDNEKEEEQKATPKTEQVTKNVKRVTPKSAKQLEPASKKVQTKAESQQVEETSQAVSEETPIAASVGEEQPATVDASVQQVDEGQAPETLAAEEQLEEVTEEPVEEPEKVYDMVEQMPEFPGGYAKMMEYISTHLQYPEDAQENGTQGRVIVQFVINADGSISDAQIARKLDPSCDNEALRVINGMPRWKPGQQGGENVRVKYTIPIVFRLQ